MVIAGVQDLSRNTMTGSVTTSFTTGDFIDTLKLNVQVLESVDPTVPFRLVFNKPVGPATVSTQTVTLERVSNPGGNGYYIPVWHGYAERKHVPVHAGPAASGIDNLSAQHGRRNGPFGKCFHTCEPHVYDSGDERLRLHLFDNCLYQPGQWRCRDSYQ
jgi:hypothetical protein